MSRGSFLPRMSADRPVTSAVLLMAVVVVGFLAYQRIPLELMPSGFQNPYLWVWIPYPNANPQEVEEQIARPVEEQVRTISGIKNVNSYSSENGCWTQLEFVGGTDMTIAYDQLRDRMERARATLPDDLERYYLRKSGNNNIPIIFLSITYPDGVEDPYYLTDYFIKRPIERLDGVANVEIWGAQEKSIQILIDQDKIKALNVDLYQVINELRSDNFALSSGWVYEGNKKFVVRSMARFDNLDDIRKLPINRMGLTVGDVARVVYDVPKRTWTQRINRRPGLLLGVFQESLANTVDLSRTLESVLDNEILTQPRFEGTDVTVFFSQGKAIEDAINNLKDTALWGGVFAIFILMYFLRNLRMTLIMMFAIPLSVLVALTVIYFMGWTLNIFTLMGLMISVGMVVDNGIVVLENIFHKRNEGMEPRKASIFGASEVNLAIIMATLTTICVFVPMILIDDESGGLKFYMQRIGLPVIYALVGSLFVALVLIPLATTRLANQKPGKEGGMIRWGKRVYDRILGHALNRRMDSVFLVLLFIVVTIISFQFTPQTDEEGGGISDINLIFDIPGNYTQEELDAYMTEVEDTLYAHADRYKLRAVDTGYNKSFARMRIYLEAAKNAQWYDIVYKGILNLLNFEKNGRMTRDEVLADLKDRVPVKPGVEFRTSWRSSSDQEGEGAVSIFLYGDDTGKLAEMAEEVERRMRLLPGVVSVDTDRESGQDEIKISLDREVATRNGINPNEVASTLMYAVRGFNLPRFQAVDKEIEVRIQLQESDRENLSQLKNITFRNTAGQAIPLSAIANFSVQKGFGEIARQNGKTYLEVRALTTEEDLGKISAQIDEIMNNFPMPFGYRWQKGSRFMNLGEQNAAFGRAVWLAIAFVYIVMAILFESLVLPLSVILTIPLAFFGAFLALNVTQTPISVMAIIGVIILIGVVVNNGIILVDMINRKRLEGLERRQAILVAGQNRFRPILMTSFTTIGGLIPMAVGNAELFVGIPYAPMGRAIIGGMLTSTFLTLVVVPVFYTLFDDFQAFLKKAVGWILDAGGGRAKTKAA